MKEQRIREMKQAKLIRTKKSIASAVLLALGSGTTVETVIADSLTANFTGWFTMINSAGTSDTTNTDLPTNVPPMYGRRTPITGTLTYDTDTDTGTMTVAGFSFFGSGLAIATNISLTGIGDGSGGPGTLILSNMGFNWNNNNGIPVSLAFDGQGLLAAFNNPINTNDVITGGATGATESFPFDFGKLGTYALPMGASPLVTTTFDTTNIGTPVVGTNPSGTLPLIADTIGGSPMPAGPFAGFNANFDLTQLTVTSFTDTTPPTLTLNGSTPVNINVGGTYTELGATCTDVQDGSLSATVGGQTVDANTPGQYIVTYDCQDTSLNNATQITRTVNVAAVGTPTISLIGNNPQTHEAATPYTDAGASCMDPEDGNIPLGGPFTGSQSFSATSTVNSNVPGSYAVTYDCTDSAGNPAPSVARTVNVVDTTPPSVVLTPSCAGGITIEAGDPDPTPTATSTDTVDGDLTGSIVKSGSVNTNPTYATGELSQNFTVGFSSTDAAGNNSIASCTVTVGNPTPVVTLNGSGSINLNQGDSFTDPGATCQDFKDGDLGAATPDIVVDTNAVGTQTITYTCTDSDNNTGTTTRTVNVGGAGLSVATNSNFTMLTPLGDFQNGTNDVAATWDGTFNTSVNDTNFNMTLATAGPTPYEGSVWFAHSIRVFGPGTYTFEACPGDGSTLGVNPCNQSIPLTMTVGPNQIGAHILFDWSTSKNIDVAIVWDIDQAFPGPSGNLNVDNRIFNLVSTDNNNDGSPGIPMVDGPFVGFRANFNLDFVPAVQVQAGIAAPELSATQGGGITAMFISGNGNITTSSSVAFTSYDWSASSPALVAASNGTTGSTFVFNPATIPAGIYEVILTGTDSGGNTATTTLPIQVLATDPGVDINDDNNDGIPNYLDMNSGDNTALQVDSTGADNLVTDSGSIKLGIAAFAEGADGAGVTNLPADSLVTQGCIGGCFDFKVASLAPGAASRVVLPLSAVLPEGAEYRKLVNGQWKAFSVGAGNAIASASRNAGTCPPPGDASYDNNAGLVSGHDCIRLTIVDGGANDADGASNGSILDPGGAGIPVQPSFQSASTGLGNGGCSVSYSDSRMNRHADWWLIGAFLAMLTWLRRKLRT